MKRKFDLDRLVLVAVIILSLLVLAIVATLPKGSMEVNPVYQQF